ncbi:hypothetical protein [Actinomyces wuliandei]|uniref:hypothetical protein n=1 Tax=Actinomyces wuliandei TaxID=2057743 RepID=UPI001118C4DA|nr:hypothetical protein [Actinomyces wuliandei]
MYLVMLETNSNQRYIFSSPRLRENIGASAQLTRLPGWVEDALTTTNVADGWEKAHPRPQDDSSGLSTQWVSRASGKVILRVDEKEQARTVVRHVTRKAFEEAPGIDVSGVFVEMRGDHVTAEDLKTIHAEAARYALVRPPTSARFSRMPFLAQAEDSVLPAAPPLGVGDESRDDREAPLSLESRVKRYQAYWSRKELIDLACQREGDLAAARERLSRDQRMLEKKLRAAFLLDGQGSGSPGNTASGTGEAKDDTGVRRLEDLLQANSRRSSPPGSGTSGTRATSGSSVSEGPEAQTSSWRRALPRVAVIHIDGNGVGAIMRDLDRALGQVPPEKLERAVDCTNDDPDALRRFVLEVSKRLNNTVMEAFAGAWADVAGWAEQDAAAAGRAPTAVPVVPVILGGDDVTVIASGDYALPFADSYLRRYEEGTRDDPLLCYLHDVDADGPTGARSRPDTSQEQQPASPGALTAAAGVVITRNGFPFHTAYDLAEKLVTRAKTVAKSQVPARSVLTYHALLDSTVLDADQALDAYSSFTTRPWLLTDKDDGERRSPAAPPVSTASPGAGQDTAAHISWTDVCQRVRVFKEGVEEENDERHRYRASATSPGAREKVVFPRTRAVRIRRYLSDAAQARLANEQGRRKRLERTAEREWEAARKARDCPRLIERIGGRKEALFDLLELADLLPDSYLGRSATADHHDPMAPAFEESQV